METFVNSEDMKEDKKELRQSNFQNNIQNKNGIMKRKVITEDEKVSKTSSSADQKNNENINKLLLPNLKLCDFQKLIVLHLTECKLRTLPNEIGFLQNLITLDLSCNNLVTLPNTFKFLTKIRNLNLSSNCINETPECISHGFLGALKNLNLANNHIKLFTVKKYHLQLLKILNLKNNNLDTFPNWLLTDNGCCLEFLDLSQNVSVLKLPVPEEIILGMSCMKNSISNTLKILNLKNCTINKCNLNFLKTFRNLDVLNLSNEYLMKFSSHNQNIIVWDTSFQNFPFVQTVTELYLSQVSLNEINTNIKKFSKLKLLDVSHNNLSLLPKELCSLKCLEVLNISGNDFITLPDELGHLKSLKKFYAASNQLFQLPESMFNLRNSLQVLDLYDNCFDKMLPLIYQLTSLKQLDFSNNYFNPNLNCAEKDNECTNNNNCRSSYNYHSLRDEFIKHHPFALDRYDTFRSLDSSEVTYDSEDSCDNHSRDKLFPDIIDEYSEELGYSDGLSKNETDVQQVAEQTRENQPSSISSQEDDWDNSYDSDEEFNPTITDYLNIGSNKVNVNSITTTTANFQLLNNYLDVNTNSYSPSKFHPKKIRAKIKRHTFGESVEGQFDYY